LNALAARSDDIGAAVAADQLALEAYLRDEILPRLKHFADDTARLRYLKDGGYLSKTLNESYSFEQLATAFGRAAKTPYRFNSYLGALKFYSSYALVDRDDRAILETYEQRVCAAALELGRGDLNLALRFFDVMNDRVFHLTSPAFANLGKATLSESISCYLVRVEDTMESVARSVNDAMQISRRNGGMSFLLTNLRERGASIAGRADHSRGIVPVMKMLEDALSYVHQGGQRQGAGAVYLHAHHPEILRFLDTKRENADEKVRIKSLSLGVVIPDITFELAKHDEEMCLFSPQDVVREIGQPLSDIDFSRRYRELESNPRITRSEIKARDFFRVIAELQVESGYPYLLFEDNANVASATPGRVTHSNLCSEIMQVSRPSVLNKDLSYESVGADITCNLGSMNVSRLMASGGDFGTCVELAVRALTAASESADLDFAPALAKGRDEARSIGVGQMNLHGFFLENGIEYGSPAALDFTSCYFSIVAYHAIRASNTLAQENSESFAGFEASSYATGRWFEKYLNSSWLPTMPRVHELFAANGVTVPTMDDWRRLASDVKSFGLYNRHLLAVAPTGSISYMNHATASIHPAPARVEVRTEGKVGRVYFPTPSVNEESVHSFRDAFEVGAEAIIDTYARAAEHTDQGLALTLFFEASATTRDINRAQIYAWKKKLKSLYYVRVRQSPINGASRY